MKNNMHLSSMGYRKMPLPNIVNGKANRCTANSRLSGQRCKNLSAYGMRTCRYHGARKQSTVKRGANHTNFKHGFETTDAKENRKAAFNRIRHYKTILAKSSDEKLTAIFK